MFSPVLFCTTWHNGHNVIVQRALCSRNAIVYYLAWMDSAAFIFIIRVRSWNCVFKLCLLDGILWPSQKDVCHHASAQRSFYMVCTHSKDNFLAILPFVTFPCVNMASVFAFVWVVCVSVVSKLINCLWYDSMPVTHERRVGYGCFGCFERCWICTTYPDTMFHNIDITHVFLIPSEIVLQRRAENILVHRQLSDWFGPVLLCLVICFSHISSLYETN